MSRELAHAAGSLPLGTVAVMGVLNVTPDSFSDGGRWLDADAAVKHGIEMARVGASVIDVGGESTRPGASEVALEVELDRVLPVIRGLVGELDVPISIDTRKAEVARRAVEAGAAIINDTQGEADLDPGLYEVVAATGAAVVVMHSRGTPATMGDLVQYDDVVEDVRAFLHRRVGHLLDLGIDEDRIALDPGIGFAKTPAQSLELLGRLERIVELGHPVLVGTSRKSFIGAVLDLPEDQRLEGTLASIAIAVDKGARIVRVHDVQAAVRAVRVAEAITRTSTT